MRKFTGLRGWTAGAGLMMVLLGASPSAADPVLAIDSLTEAGGHPWFAKCGVRNIGDRDAAAYKLTFMLESVDGRNAPVDRLLSQQRVVRQKLVPGAIKTSRWTGLSDGSFGDPVSAKPWRPEPGRYVFEACASLDLDRNNSDSIGTCSREYFDVPAAPQQESGMGQELLGRIFLGY